MMHLGETLIAALPLAVVLIVMCGVGLLLIGRLRPAGGRRKLRSYGSTDRIPGYFGGFITVVALVQGLAAFGLRESPPYFVIGALIAFGLSLTRRFAPAIGSIAGGFGLIALAMGVLAPGSGDRTTVERLLLLAAIAVAMLLGALGARIAGFGAQAGLLLVFAVLETLLFIIEPLGVPLLAESVAYVPIAMLVAAVAGFGGMIAPELVYGITGVLMGLAAIGIAAGVGDLDGERSWAGVLAIFGYSLVWMLVSGMRRKRR